MCGRYALDQNARELANHFQLLSVPEFSPRYNIAPGTPVLVVRGSPAGRIAETMLWGLEPAWARQPGPSGRSYPKPINARAESVTEKPMFRSPFRTRRCILPASGFYEWRRPDGGAKQPFFIKPANDGVFALAGLYEPGDDAHPPTCCIITTGANECMAPIHDRMPVILDPASFGDWLGTTSDAARLAALLVPSPAEEMLAYPVSTRVNAARNDDPSLVVRADPTPGPAARPPRSETRDS